jgi:hypothetical protein
MLGLFPALLAPISFVYYLLTIPVVRDMRRGTSSIARWTVSPDELRRFRDEDARVSKESWTANWYEPPADIPAGGLEVVFSDGGVLIGDGYFPLSTTGGRRVHRVHVVHSHPPMIEFGMILATRAQTSSTTSAAARTSHALRVPVAGDAVLHAAEVAGRYSAAIARR